MLNLFSWCRINSKPKPIWCCKAFDNSVAMSEESGIHVVPSRNLLGERVFLLSGKMFNVSVIEQCLKDSTELYPFISCEDMKGQPLVCFRYIQFCPWSGANLKKLISRRSAKFDEIERGLHRVMRWNVTKV